MKKNFFRERIYYYLQLMRFHKPAGIFLLLWPTLWALWIAAEGIPSISILLIFIAGVVLMRAAGCIINDYADRHWDRHVERTKSRPLTSGKITVWEALMLFCILCSIAFGLVLLLNRMVIVLSGIAIMLAIIYPFMKRYTHWPQFFLGLVWSFSVLIAFAAVSASIPKQAWLLFLITMLWTVAYDTQYAMADRSDDLKIGIKSTAIFWGSYDCYIIGCLQWLVLMSLFILGWWLSLSFIYFLALALAANLALYQQYLIKDRIPKKCLRAFLNNQWFGFVIFLGIFLNYC